MSLKQVLEPAMHIAEGYPIELETVRRIERYIVIWHFKKRQADFLAESNRYLTINSYTPFQLSTGGASKCCKHRRI